MIICFSGTGNTLHAAKLLASHSGESIVQLPVERSQKIVLPEGDSRVVWMFPVYSWGVPPAVCKMIRNIQIPNGHKFRHFAIMTCGDDVGLTDSMWRSELARRGWTGRDAYSVQMPNTYVLMKGFDTDPIDVADAKIKAASSRMAQISEKLNAACQRSFENPLYESDLVRGRFAWIKSKVIYPWFKRFAMSPKYFFPNQECIGCQICVKNCPLGNIKMGADNRPEWKNNCALCLRCYHICPRHAVSYSTATRGKGQSRMLINQVANPASVK